MTLFLLISMAFGADDPKLCRSGDEVAIQVCELVNELRREQEIHPLESDRHLTQVAESYARELSRKGKLTHGDFRDRMRRAGIGMPAAENIARGQKTPPDVLATWSRSDGHRKNMLNLKYTKIGVGEFNGYWVQIFSGKSD